jgi:hypothetical protein
LQIRDYISLKKQIIAFCDGWMLLPALWQNRLVIRAGSSHQVDVGA